MTVSRPHPSLARRRIVAGSPIGRLVAARHRARRVRHVAVTQLLRRASVPCVRIDAAPRIAVTIRPSAVLVRQTATPARPAATPMVTIVHPFVTPRLAADVAPPRRPGAPMVLSVAPARVAPPEPPLRRRPPAEMILERRAPLASQPAPPRAIERDVPGWGDTRPAPAPARVDRPDIVPVIEIGPLTDRVLDAIGRRSAATRDRFERPR